MAICLAGMLSASAAVASPQRTQIVSASFDLAAARHGTQVTLTVETLNARCVTLAGAHSGSQTAITRDADTWTFVLTAGAGDHPAQVAVYAFVSPECTGPSDSASAYYLLDNTAPVITISRSRDPIPVEFWDWVEWHDGDVTYDFQCSDTGGSGVRSCPAAQTFTREGIRYWDVVAEDNVGNVAWWSSEIGLDETPPTATAETLYLDQVTGSDGREWGTRASVYWSCRDYTFSHESGWLHGSGVVDCPAYPIEVTTEGFQVPVTTTIHDGVGHESTPTVYVNIDRTGPTVTGEIGYERPVTARDGTEWGSAAYVRWSCEDPNGSGVAHCGPTFWWETEVTTEGFQIPISTTAHDWIGNETTSTVYANIDRTPPSTTISPLPGWPGTFVFNSIDNLSGMDGWFTHRVDGGLWRGQSQDDSGAAYIFLDPGTHTIEYWLEDNAGNVEHHSVQLYVP